MYGEIKAKLLMCVISTKPRRVGMSEGTFPFGLNIDATFTPRPLYLPGKEPQYQLVRPQSRSARCEGEESLANPDSAVPSPYRSSYTD
jgi:hypothetical protein